MTKTNKQEHKSAEDVAMTLEQQKEQAIDQECSKEIEQVLLKYNRALQPFIAYSEFNVSPRVRLTYQEANVETNVEEAV